MLSTSFEIPIFRGTVTLYYVKELKEVEEKYKTRSLKDYGAIAMHNPTSSFKDYIVAFECIDYSLVAHEIVHLINYLFLDCGIELDRTNDETQAYLTGFFFHEIEKFLEENRDKI